MFTELEYEHAPSIPKSPFNSQCLYFHLILLSQIPGLLSYL